HHAYPGKSAEKVTDDAAARASMLSEAWHESYQAMHDAFVPAALANGLSFRLEEANSFFHGGAKNVSDSYASALWVLDFLHWWAAHDANGINLHTLDSLTSQGPESGCKYAVFRSASGGYSVRPMAYGIKAFDLGCHGRLVPVKSAGGKINAYAVLGADRSLV